MKDAHKCQARHHCSSAYKKNPAVRIEKKNPLITIDPIRVRAAVCIQKSSDIKIYDSDGQCKNVV